MVVVLLLLGEGGLGRGRVGGWLGPVVLELGGRETLLLP